MPEPFFREAGTGPGVVSLHANASTSGQWRGLMELLAPNFRVLAPDSYDSGKSPQWPSDRVIQLRDEVELIEPVLTRAGSPLALVGHSYGAAVALIAALANPGRVRAMALYEPTLFALLDAETPAPNEAEGIRNAVADAGVALDEGNQDAAAERFIDSWMGTGTWNLTSEQRKRPIAASVTNVRRWAYALFTEPTPLEAFKLGQEPGDSTWSAIHLGPGGSLPQPGVPSCGRFLPPPRALRWRSCGAEGGASISRARAVPDALRADAIRFACFERPGQSCNL